MTQKNYYVELRATLFEVRDDGNLNQETEQGNAVGFDISTDQRLDVTGLLQAARTALETQVRAAAGSATETERPKEVEEVNAFGAQAREPDGRCGRCGSRLHTAAVCNV